MSLFRKLKIHSKFRTRRWDNTTAWNQTWGKMVGRSRVQGRRTCQNSSREKQADHYAWQRTEITTPNSGLAQTVILIFLSKLHIFQSFLIVKPAPNPLSKSSKFLLSGHLRGYLLWIHHNTILLIKLCQFSYQNRFGWFSINSIFRCDQFYLLIRWADVRWQSNSFIWLFRFGFDSTNFIFRYNELIYFFYWVFLSDNIRARFESKFQIILISFDRLAFCLWDKIEKTFSNHT